MTWLVSVSAVMLLSTSAVCDLSVFGGPGAEGLVRTGGDVVEAIRRDAMASTGGLMAGMVEAMFGQFRQVELASVWQEIRSRKVVSFSVVRDATQVTWFRSSCSTCSVPVCSSWWCSWSGWWRGCCYGAAPS